MPRWSRQILFGDVDAMYASAAIVADPSLAEKVMAVGSPPPRGIITSASYPARRWGVKAAMPTVQALRRCPGLVLVPPDHGLYQRLHDRMRGAELLCLQHPLQVLLRERGFHLLGAVAVHDDNLARRQRARSVEHVREQRGDDAKDDLQVLLGHARV